MRYVREVISSANQETIMNDADERKKKFLRARGGHFENNPNLPWAIDRQPHSYLFSAPPSIGHPSETRYYFFHENVMCALRHGPGNYRTIYFDDRPPPSGPLLEILKKELRQAFLVHGALGVLHPKPRFDVRLKGMDSYRENCLILGAGASA